MQTGNFTGIEGIKMLSKVDRNCKFKILDLNPILIPSYLEHNRHTKADKKKQPQLGSKDNCVKISEGFANQIKGFAWTAD